VPASDGFAAPNDLENSVADRIVAGGILTDQLTDRF